MQSPVLTDKQYSQFLVISNPVGSNILNTKPRETVFSQNYNNAGSRVQVTLPKVKHRKTTDISEAYELFSTCLILIYIL